MIADVYAGKVHPRVAAGLAPLLNLQLRAIETTDLENRLIRVEKLLAKAEEDSGPKRVRFPGRRGGGGYRGGESIFSDRAPDSPEGT
jgi:hypothetical protein